MWMQAHHYEKMKELVYPPPQYWTLLVNLFVTLRQTDLSVEEEMVNYWAEICKPLPRDKRNVALHAVTI